MAGKRSDPGNPSGGFDWLILAAIPLTLLIGVAIDISKSGLPLGAYIKYTFGINL